LTRTPGRTSTSIAISKCSARDVARSSARPAPPPHPTLDELAAVGVTWDMTAMWFDDLARTVSDGPPR
jgi:hypothetical protein